MNRPRAQYHHGDLRAALLAEAVAQVRARGAEQVSLRGLAQQVGVSASAAYQHFPDKAALLVAVGEWAFGELARRMRAGTAAVAADGDAGAVERFAAIGRAYVTFAAGESHLFRHMFGALLAQKVPGEPAVPGPVGLDAPPGPDAPDSPYDVLSESLAELSARGLLRPRAGVPEGLDVLTWSVVHGFSALVVEGHLPPYAGEPLLLLFGRLVLADGAADLLAWPVAG